MKLRIITIVVHAAFFAVFADINSVAVPTGMLHQPNLAMGMGFTGKVQYALTPLTNDSIFVDLQILPVGGGPALALMEKSGDVGSIRVNTNLPTTSKTYSIFFQAAAPQPGVQYFAKITANAVVTTKKTQVDGYLASMSKYNKAVLMGSTDADKTTNGSPPIPKLYTLDGPHGVSAHSEMKAGLTATSFATSVGQACTWDTALSRMQGEMMGAEFRSYGRNCALSPAGNIVFHPMQGRAGEYYSEDPYLSGQLMAASVKGIQSKKVMTTIKHFACNQIEANRTTMSASMNERSLREIYLYNFEPSIVKANAWGVMGAYNKINGSYACSNKYTLSDVLRNEWGFKYTVVTDWFGAFDNRTQAVQWGSDIELPQASQYAPANLNGFSDSLINMHARRIINVHQELGDLVPGYTATDFARETQEHFNFVRTAGGQSIILAKNNGNILPLPKTGAKIAVTGPYRNMGNRISTQGSCWVNPTWGKVVNGLNAIKAKLTGPNASTVQDNVIAGANYIVVFVGPTGEGEMTDRTSLAVRGADGDIDAAAALAAPSAKTVVVYTGGSASSAGNWSKADAIVIMLYPGMMQFEALADILFGDVNPSGKLPVTFPQNQSQLPSFVLTGNTLIYPGSDTAHGYFRMDKLGATPLFHFGHGLSYTTFSYSNLQIYPSQIQTGDRVKVSVTVTNTGTKPGREVVQLYLSMPNTNPALPVRVQDLRGFNKILLEPGAGKTVNFVLTEEEMRVFDTDKKPYPSPTGKWTVIPGTYGVRVGTSSNRAAQPSLSGSFKVN